MPIILVSSSDSVSDVLNQFEANFSSIFNWVVTEKEFGRSMAAISEALAKTCYICDLKRVADFLAINFSVVSLDAPKRNSKVSLAGWIAQVLLSVREMADALEAIAPTESIVESVERPPDKDYWCPQCKAWMDRSGFNEVLGSDFQEQLCKVCGTEVYHEFDQRVLQAEASHGVNVGSGFEAIAAQPLEAPGVGVEVETLEPEEKPGYKISMHTDRLSSSNTSARAAWNFTEEWVSCLPPYLVDRQGNLFYKTWSPSCHAHYSQLVCKNLSNIAAVAGGTKIKLVTDDLVVREAYIHGEPPPFIIFGAGVYKRIPRLACESPPAPLYYAQLIAENLSNIVLGRQANCG